MTELTISKSSRLGRYYNWLYYRWNGKRDVTHWHINNLCQFVRRLVIMTILVVSAYAVLCGIVGWLLFCAGYVIYWPFAHGWIMPPNKSFMGLVVRLGLGVWGFVALVGIVVGIVALKERSEDRAWKRQAVNCYVKPPRQPNLVWAWLKAKKQKVCPLIKVVD